MASGVPLNDEDRAPWLARIHDVIRDYLGRGETAVITCSALKKRYRERLDQDLSGVVFIHLDGRFDLIWQRMEARDDHFMKAEMLQSQFEALEAPAANEALIIDIDQPVEAVLDDVIIGITEKLATNEQEEARISDRRNS
jgi:gluconokinase